ncbi:MAG TPA: ABC transporter permease [Kofleriaceae bacterium]|nr:ABC transporter permease [Kofleriaceae bacterium]
MAYENFIGGRYLFGGRVNRAMLVRAGIAGVIALAGLAILLTSNGGSPVGVLMLLLGMITAAVIGLMAVFSVFTSVSVLGVALGVAALTVVLSVTTGFQAQFREKVLGVNAHVIVLKQQSTFAEYRDVMKTAMEIDADVLAAQPFIFAEMLVTRGKGQLSGVAIKGVDPALVRGVLDLDKHMLDGASIDSLARVPGPGEYPAIIMGRELARKLKAKVGDDVTVVVPLSNIDFDTWRAKSSAPRTRKFHVTGIFYSGFDEYDRRLMYTALKDIQDLVGRGDQVMGVELKVKDVERAGEIARNLEAALGGPPYQVQDWYELNHNLFTALEIQKKTLVLILTIIIAVATFNMVSALIMMVREKTREVAILKSMGTRSIGIGLIFQIVGLAIAGVGTLVGVAIGLTTCHVVSVYGYKLDPKVYLIDRLPIVVRPFEVLLVVLITMGIGLVVTIVPAWSAAAMRPADGLRHD